MAAERAGELVTMRGNGVPIYHSTLVQEIGVKRPGLGPGACGNARSGRRTHQ